MYRLFTLIATISLPFTAFSDDYPQKILKNDSLALTVLIPDAQKGYYRGSRFDWTGIVSEIKFSGHTIFQEWRSPHDPNGPDDVGGTAEEFGMLKTPHGFTEAKTGETFLKIGVGELVKPDDKPYEFNRRYSIKKPAETKITSDSSSITFSQSIITQYGYGYQLTKKVALDPKSSFFSIERTLKNTGTKTINTDHYGHNFLSVNKVPVGPDYTLSFEKKPVPRTAKTDFKAGAKLDETQLRFERMLLRSTIYTELDGFGDDRSGHQVTFADSRTGIAITIKGDRPVKEWHVWAIKTALCPEPFIEFSLEPGKEFSWSTSYTLKKSEAK